MQMPEYVCVKASIPENLVRDVRDFGSFPTDWMSADPIGSREFGTRWIRRRHSAALRIPSAVIPRESNFLLNPAHPDFSLIILDPPLRFEFDIRLFGKTQ